MGLGWRKVCKLLTFTNQHQYFSIMYFLRCTQREGKTNKTLVEQYRELFESRISETATATAKLPGWEEPHTNTVAWSCSTESKIISLGLEFIPALDSWDVVMKVLHSSNNVPPNQKISAPKSKPKRAAGNCRHNVHNIRLKKEGDRNAEQLSNPDYATTSAHYPRSNPSCPLPKTTKPRPRRPPKEEAPR